MTTPKQSPHPTAIHAATHRRNRMMGLVVACVVGMMFLATIAITLIIHYSEIHHALSSS